MWTLSEFAFDVSAESFGHLLILHTFEHFFEKAEDEKLLGSVLWDTATAEIEELFLVDFARGGTVTTFYFVGEDFEAGQRIRLSRWA